MKELYDKELLKCGFKKCGSAYFRILEDEVLQILKFEYERVFSHYVLRIGLFSLYSNLNPAWLSSKGCIPQYDIVQYVNYRNSIITHNLDELFSVCTFTPEQQIEILLQYALPRLNNISSQLKLVQEMDYLEQKENDLDIFRIAPLLYIRNYSRAKNIVLAIRDQRFEWRTFAEKELNATKNENKKRNLLARLELDYMLDTLLNLIETGNEERIREYLNKNKDLNLKLLVSRKITH